METKITTDQLSTPEFLIGAEELTDLNDSSSDEQVPSTSTILRDSSFVAKHQRKCSSDDGIHYVDDDDGVGFSLDSKNLNKVHEELEKLNIATDLINSLELHLDESRSNFKQIHAKWSQRIDEISKKYKNSIQKSRPYYEALNEEQKLRSEAQIATARFKKANSTLQNAKQQIKQTQETLNKEKILDSEALELLNRHIQEVNDAEQERLIAEEFHRAISQKMLLAAYKIKQMEKENAKAIKKSRIYFELMVEFNLVMNHQKAMISRLETEVKQKKKDYNTSLTNLEKISNSIHEERSLSSMKRANENTI